MRIAVSHEPYAVSSELIARPLKRQTAAHLDDRTIDIARLVGREAGERIGDFFRLGEPAERHALFESAYDALRNGLDDGGLDEPRTHGVGAYTPAAELLGP